MRHKMLLALSVLSFLALAFAGCRRHSPGEEEKSVPAVKFRYPIKRDVPYYAYFTGRTAAPEAVDLLPQVTGYLTAVKLKAPLRPDGKPEPYFPVVKDQVLFEIDPRPYEADLDSAEAQILLARAQYKLAAANLARERDLAASRATSARDIDVIVAKMSETDASLKSAEAAKRKAKLNLDWTKVKSPIDGNASRNLLTVGNLVKANETMLTSIYSEDPMYAYFDVDENTMLRIKKMINEGKFKAGDVPVEFGLSDEDDRYPHVGKIDFVNPSVNPKTGTLQVRGIFDNPKVGKGGRRVLIPGLFVRVRTQLGEDRPSLLVPQAAVQTELCGKVVLVVDKENKIERRPVSLGPIAADGLQVIEPELLVRTKEGFRAPKEGETGEPSITAADRVIVSGLQRIRPGMTVTAAEAPAKKE
jgi:multidrug efflux system membrane fusion protein